MTNTKPSEPQRDTRADEGDAEDVAVDVDVRVASVTTVTVAGPRDGTETTRTACLEHAYRPFDAAAIRVSGRQSTAGRSEGR